MSSGTQLSDIDIFTKNVTGIFKKGAASFRNLAGISSETSTFVRISLTEFLEYKLLRYTP